MISLFRFCVLLLSCRLYYFSLHGDYPPFLKCTTQSIYKAASPFLINWNEKQSNESNILTMDHELVLENSSSAAVYTLLNTIIYLKSQSIWISDWSRSIKRTLNLGSKDGGSNSVLSMAVRIWDYCVEN